MFSVAKGEVCDSIYRLTLLANSIFGAILAQTEAFYFRVFLTLLCRSRKGLYATFVLVPKCYIAGFGLQV